jgi:hypothetical protein
MMMDAILNKIKRPVTLCLIAVASVTLVCVLALPAESAMAWKVKIKINVEDREDSGKAILGAATDATDGFENAYEARAILSGHLMTYFFHPEWSKDTNFFWTDVRDTALPKEWSWYVQSRYRNREHTMTWTIDAPEGLELYLMDTVTGEVIDMRAEGSYSYNNISTARRTFVIEATGSIGEEEVALDTTPPETMITSAPSGYLAETSYGFAYTGTDDVSGASSLEYSYSFDGSEWSDFDMNTSTTISTVGEGLHTFRVKAKDMAGNIDPTPAEASFVVDLTPPELILSSVTPELLWPPNGKMKDVTVSGSITDALSGVKSLTYTVIDEYGEINTTGTVPTTGGPFTLVVELMAMRNGNDLDGRVYTISFTGIDNVGNAVTGSVDVLVPHDRAVKGR